MKVKFIITCWLNIYLELNANLWCKWLYTNHSNDCPGKSFHYLTNESKKIKTWLHEMNEKHTPETFGWILDFIYNFWYSQATTGQLLAVVYMELNEESFYQKALYVIGKDLPTQLTYSTLPLPNG